MRVLCCCVLALALGTVGVTRGVGQEKKIKRSDLPPAVERTVVARSQGATIRGFSQEEEKGQNIKQVEALGGVVLSKQELEFCIAPGAPDPKPDVGESHEKVPSHRRS